MNWRYEKGAAVLDEMTPSDIACRNEEIEWLKKHEMKNWRLINGRLATKKEPIALESFFGGLVAVPPAAQISTTSVNGEVGLWAAATYTPIGANVQIVPEVYRVIATGQCTTSTSPGNATWTPRVGTTTGGSALGASGAIALTASITNSYWYLQGDCTVRSIGPSTSGSMIANFIIHHRHAIAGAGDFVTTTASTTGIQIFGNTVATYDSTAAQGLFMGMANTVTTITWKVDQIHWMSWN